MILTVLAARVLKRPVKLVLTRPQMFTSVGHRPKGVSTSGSAPHDYEPLAAGSTVAHDCPDVVTRDRQARLNIPCPTSMRGSDARTVKE